MLVVIRKNSTTNTRQENNLLRTSLLSTLRIPSFVERLERLWLNLVKWRSSNLKTYCNKSQTRFKLRKKKIRRRPELKF